MNPSLKKKPRILVGVTGSVAAYKAVELVRRLKAFAEVQVVLTDAGSRLVPEQTLKAASGNPVGRGLFQGAKAIPPGTPSGSHPLTTVPHIEFAKKADLLLIAPATADSLAKLALGLADDLLSTICLYAVCPVWVAPAMNVKMWNHPAVQDHRRALLKRGVRFLGPESGHLACGEVGEGRFVEPSETALQVESFFKNSQKWKGKKVVVTAGPTQEPLDPVRMVTNRSSGKMGYALAQAALNRGAEVTLITGPVSLLPLQGARMAAVKTAEEMRRETGKAFEKADLLIMAAAVADFRPLKTSPVKMKKGPRSLVIHFEKTPDILGEMLRKKKKGQKVMGFCAETDHLLENAGLKWKKKPCDMLVANQVGQKGSGFEGDKNEVWVFRAGWEKPRLLRKDLKSVLAEKLLDLVDGLPKE
jgi:phosphopantothenoylcysteine decarboxylase/phosphopantothenate--cysteine ligase